MRTIKFIITLILGISCCVYIGYLTELQSASASYSSHGLGAVNAPDGSASAPILSIEDFQRLLNKIEPSNPIECDGKLGPATQKKWDRIICNQYAKVYHTETQRHGETKP